jgi:hypothetical protein
MGRPELYCWMLKAASYEGYQADRLANTPYQSLRPEGAWFPPDGCYATHNVTVVPACGGLGLHNPPFITMVEEPKPHPVMAYTCH